jgi:hypothetical protein
MRRSASQREPGKDLFVKQFPLRLHQELKRRAKARSMALGMHVTIGDILTEAMEQYTRYATRKKA